MDLSDTKRFRGLGCAHTSASVGTLVCPISYQLLTMPLVFESFVLQTDPEIPFRFPDG